MDRTCTVGRAHPATYVCSGKRERHSQDPSVEDVLQAKSLYPTEMQVMMTNQRARSPDLSRLLCRRRHLRRPIAVSAVFRLHTHLVLSGITLGVSMCEGIRESLSLHVQSTPFHQMKSGRRLETGLISLRTKSRYLWHPIWHACDDHSK